ncbi:hypothetical protein AVEN_209077-1 [Araneus ventricosus]|uniref:Uncharacterized protein n=1 Tax=Araneus ventricosus TaxID=182803 RepID=A0A4Y2SRL6_ARAVE|nr:hypothetical protein AVEN_209077-1 [Araneus ventricosus]
MACGLIKPRVARGLYLWTVVRGIPTSKAVPTVRSLANLSAALKRTGALTRSGHSHLLWCASYLPPKCEQQQMHLQAHEPLRFLLFRRWEITRNADGTRGKTGRRNAA